VKAFKREIKAGSHKPIVAVRVPGSNKLRIVDGHHHFKGYDDLGYPAPTYIAHVEQNTGPWDEMHAYQRRSADPDSSKALMKSSGTTKKIPVRTPKQQPFGDSLGRIVTQLRKSGDAELDRRQVQYPMKKCDYCQRPEKFQWLQKYGGAIEHRCCRDHVPQTEAEIRWSQNNQVSPSSPSPYEPFQRAVTQ
jgi:hypothetical protein